MPGLPLVVHETTNLGCNCSCSRNAEQMCRQNSRVHLSAEEAIAAEESLSVYCKPVELYNILQRRALQNPSFLQRCLDYKIQARRSKRIQVAVSLYSSQDDVAKLQTVVPLKVLLARPVTNNAVGEQFAIYRVIRASELTSFSAFGSRDRSKVIFLIPQMGSHEDSKSNNLTILFIGHVKSEGFCLLGKLSVGTLYLSCDKFSSLYMGHRVDMLSIVEMHPIFLEHGAVAEDDCIAFRIPHVSPNISSSTQVQVNISAQEVGGKEPSPYHSFAYDDVPSSSLSHILRLRAGNVIFNYRYYNNSLQKTEVTEDFSCSFCLVKCASFKGLRYHLTSSHDLFNFEFWVTEEYQAVNVSVKADVLKSEIVADGVDPRHQTFFLCSRPRMRQKTRNGYQHSDNVHPQKLDSLEAVDASPRGYLAKIASKDSFVTSPMDVEPSNGFSSQKFDDGQLHTYSGESSKEDDRPFKELDSENYPSQNAHKSESNGYGADVTPHTLLQFAKTRKLSLERTDPRNRLLLQKRQFFHSHRAQPMAIEQVLSDRDSEDEVDDDIADFEDRRMLDDFVDVTRDEKQIMHLWNSFVRKQRVLADGHIPWACEAFSRLHGQEFVGSPALIWCWRLLMIKLWNHGLLDGRTMNQCNLILEGYTKDSDANKS